MPYVPNALSMRSSILALNNASWAELYLKAEGSPIAATTNAIRITDLDLLNPNVFSSIATGT